MVIFQSLFFNDLHDLDPFSWTDLRDLRVLPRNSSSDLDLVEMSCLKVRPAINKKYRGS